MAGGVVIMALKFVRKRSDFSMQVMRIKLAFISLWGSWLLPMLRPEWLKNAIYTDVK